MEKNHINKAEKWL